MALFRAFEKSINNGVHVADTRPVDCGGYEAEQHAEWERKREQNAAVASHAFITRRLDVAIDADCWSIGWSIS